MKKTIADYPDLVKEWHPTLNSNLMPKNVSAGSGKKVWWKCVKNHEWATSCNNRTTGCKTNCPYCVNQKVCIDNCLSTLFPEIAKEWHPTKNDNLTPNNTVAGAHKKVWWKCSKNHEWIAGCCDRTYGKRRCPYCANKKVCKDNCLTTTHPELTKEWHPVLNFGITPNEIVAGSNKSFWWKCDKHHEWKTSCIKRINGNGCPYCANKKACKDNCLATLFPEIAIEWHPTKNGNLTPNDITAGSDKKIWWKCKNEHEYRSVCKNRTGKGKHGCPICNESKGEKEVVRILEKFNIFYKREFKFDNCKNVRNLPFDFVIKTKNIAKIIEYHGIQHYEPRCFGSKVVCKHENLKGIQDRDKIKKDFCESRGIPFLEISYKDYDKIEELITKFVET